MLRHRVAGRYGGVPSSKAAITVKVDADAVRRELAQLAARH